MMKKRGGLLAAMAAAALAVSACTAPTADPSASAAGAAGECPAGALCKVGDVVKPKDGKTYKIGVSFPVLDQFLQTVADGMKARAAEAGVELSIVSAQERTDVQLNNVQNFIAANVDAMIVIPQDTQATDPITQKAQEAKIPLVYVNRRPANLPNTIPYVGSDSLYAGQVEMEALAKLVGNKGNVAILQGDPSQEAAILRTKGCKEVAEKLGMQVIRKQAGLWARDKGLQIAENWIQSGDQIDVICSNNDEMALGAINAYKKAGKLDTVKIGGVDATKDALAAMKAGELPVTVFQDAKGQGKGGVDAAVQLANGGKVAATLDVPYVLVTPDNMAEFENR